jgi:hypothetical protein
MPKKKIALSGFIVTSLATAAASCTTFQGSGLEVRQMAAVLKERRRILKNIIKLILRLFGAGPAKTGRTCAVFRFFRLILFSSLLSACSSLQAGIYLSSIDNLDGESIKRNEAAVKEYLEAILDKPENYAIRLYERNGISYQFKRTKLMYHSFYVITDGNDIHHTLSFYGTKIAFYSEGAWIMDGDSDKQAYDLFAGGENKWDVVEIKFSPGIDLEKTIKNIIKKMENGVTYYYKDHLNDKPGMDNCNTAVYETLTKTNL